LYFKRKDYNCFVKNKLNSIATVVIIPIDWRKTFRFDTTGILLSEERDIFCVTKPEINRD